MSTFLNAGHVSAAGTNNTVKWNKESGAFTFTKRVDGQFRDVPVTQPFAMDIFMTQHGCEWWQDKTRHVAVASVNDPAPPAPDATLKPTKMFVVPVYSAEMGGRRDLIVKGEAPTAALVAFYEAIRNVVHHAESEGELLVPIVRVTTQQTPDFDLGPVFAAARDDWMGRRTNWPKPIVTFL